MPPTLRQGTPPVTHNEVIKTLIVRLPQPHWGFQSPTGKGSPAWAGRQGLLCRTQKWHETQATGAAPQGTTGMEVAGPTGFCPRDCQTLAFWQWSPSSFPRSKKVQQMERIGRSRRRPAPRLPALWPVGPAAHGGRPLSTCSRAFSPWPRNRTIGATSEKMRMPRLAPETLVLS